MNLKDKLIETLSQQNLYPVGKTGFFVKMFTVRELNENTRIGEQFVDDGFRLERNVALELYDENGSRVFDPLNADDLRFLREKMPASVIVAVRQLSDEVNHHDFFWQKMQGAPNSTPETDLSLN